MDPDFPESSPSQASRALSKKKGKKSSAILERRTEREETKKPFRILVTPTQAAPFLMPAIPSGIEHAHRLKVALKLSLACGTFLDTKFYAFSRRRVGGGVDKPVGIYASSSLLRAASPYFEGLLSSGFDESKIVNIDGDDLASHLLYSEDYGYDSDSDLEDEELPDSSGGNIELNSDETLPGTPAEHSHSTAPPRPKIRFERPGRIVHIPNAAHATFQALIYYLCTDDITFRPLKSSSKSPTPTHGTGSTNPLGYPCSPKSMYILADLLGIDPLKEQCKREIQNHLEPQNIVPELFSRFTSRYPSIRDMEIDHLLRHRQNTTVQDSLPVWIEAITSGALPYCTETLNVLIPRLLRGS
ncbi:hypothetical protein BXZ70DRAFT_77199 [Cristinia sonorae]|uniref:BTB domain-containing protein n=1 Tax=Cristinia sonorae TaxID=1940300 RepID=A0A8K0XQX6_9AGAR|nr:hypothetical protein BXZ70DRAFT_77199 [Cristinia sonorae]